MIYCVWYPGGGFGHFVNAVITLYGQGFKRPNDTDFEFSDNGSSHKLDLVLPKYLHDPATYQHTVSLDPNLNYSVLIDNSMHNEGEKFKNFFPGARVIKICYSDFTWPVVAKTMIVKTSDIGFEQAVNTEHGWNTNEDWAVREKYFLYLRDHHCRKMWKPNKDLILEVSDLFEYQTLQNKLSSFGISTNDFESFWNNWFDRNRQYIEPVLLAKQLLESIEKDINCPIDTDDIWTQSIVYFLIWVRYHFEIPHNDHADFFRSTSEIIQLLKQNNCYA